MKEIKLEHNKAALREEFQAIMNFREESAAGQQKTGIQN